MFFKYSVDLTDSKNHNAKMRTANRIFNEVDLNRRSIYEVMLREFELPGALGILFEVINSIAAEAELSMTSFLTFPNTGTTVNRADTWAKTIAGIAANTEAPNW